ncbi:Uncharacterised protein [uncultured archaeon]|nr:Uncharacterised protein [uncultured archaeon]
MAEVMTIVDIIRDLMAKVTIAIRTPYVVSAKPANVFVSESGLLKEMADRVSFLIGDAMVKIQDAIIAEPDDLKDSVNAGIMKKLGKLKVFYESIRDNGGILPGKSEFSGTPIIAPFIIVENWANILTEQYK